MPPMLALQLVLVADTGPLVVTADRSDKDHAVCRALLEGDEGPLAGAAVGARVGATVAGLIREDIRRRDQERGCKPGSTV